jgi:60 kDa SS-A/Ro ribonucleoprotein
MYTQHFSTRQTPQSEPIPNEVMVKNSAGGYGYELDKWKRAERFLVLGTEGGSYYASEKELTVSNCQAIVECLKEDSAKLVDLITDISDKGRASKNSPALFALAIVAGLGENDAKNYALKQLSKVARTGTHLMQFVEYVEAFRGWGRSLKKAVQQWYLGKSPQFVAYQVLKYKQRNKWSQRDLLRLSHPKTSEEDLNAVFKYVVKGEVTDHCPAIIKAVESLKNVNPSNKDGIELAYNLIVDNNIPREALPTEALNNERIWRALLKQMPLTAFIRNLNKLSALGILKNMDAETLNILNEKLSPQNIRGSRVHPLTILTAAMRYKEGKGDKGSLTWPVVAPVTASLVNAFYDSFNNIEPTNKSFLIGVDVSGSMSAKIGTTGISSAQAAATLAMAIQRTEKLSYVFGFSNTFKELGINSTTSLDEACDRVQDRNFGSTDCALPMLHALENNLNVDVFVVITDNETWAGHIHPKQALQQYRERMNPNAKLVVIGTTANNICIADPKDANMLDIVGMDTNMLSVIREFVSL